jgi:transposase
MKAISMDLRKRIVESYDAGEGTRQEIADRFKVSIHMVKLLSQRRKLGSLTLIQLKKCGPR